MSWCARSRRSWAARSRALRARRHDGRKAFQRELPEAALADIREEVAAQPEMGSGGEESAEFAPDHPEMAGRSLVLPVSIRGHGAPQAWLVAARDAGGLGDFERLILQQAVTVVALELMRQRAMRDTERRLAGDVLAEALDRAALGERAGGADASVRRRRGGRGARLRRSRRRAAPRPRATSTASSPTPASARSWPRGSGCCARWSTRARTAIRSRLPPARGRRSPRAR